MKYTKDGNVVESVGAIIFLIVGIGVATLVLIFVSVLGGQTYQSTQSNLLAVNSSSTVIYGNITAAIGQSFVSLNTVGSYMPIIVLAVVIFIVLALVMGIMPGLGFGRGTGGYGGSVL